MCSTTGLEKCSLKRQNSTERISKALHLASFKILHKIGQGGFGQVYTVEKMNGPDERSIYAMKVNHNFLG